MYIIPCLKYTYYNCRLTTIQLFVLNHLYFIVIFFRCRASADCLGFLVNYERESCSRLDSNSDESRTDIVSTPSKINYFEKVCLRGETYIISILTDLYKKEI